MPGVTAEVLAVAWHISLNYFYSKKRDRIKQGWAKKGKDKKPERT